MKTSDPPTWEDIRQEYKETFGYIRNDIAAICNSKYQLQYTVLLLACCACEMIAAHQREHVPRVFLRLSTNGQLNDTHAKILWDAVRNGLAHRFRPHAIRINEESLRFRFFWGRGKPMQIGPTGGDGVRWIDMNTLTLAERVIALIDEYEAQLKSSPDARRLFCREWGNATKPVSRLSVPLDHLWRSLQDD